LGLYIRAPSKTIKRKTDIQLIVKIFFLNSFTMLILVN
jgi:hypothetical protein